MKRKKLIYLLIAEALILILLRCMLHQRSDQVLSALIYPFLLFGNGLNALASGGTVGAGIAAAIWIGLSVLPAAVALRNRNRGMEIWERLALWFLTLTLAVGLYGMAVPARIWPHAAELGAEAETVLRFVLVSMICSTVILWGVLYLIRRFRSGGWGGLLRSAGILGCVICVFLTAAAAIAVSKFVLTIVETDQNEFEIAVDAAYNLPLTLLQYAIQIIPLLLDVAVILRGMDLLNEMRSGAEENVVPAAERLSRICCISLGLSAALPAGFNLIQVLLARSLSNVNVKAEFSLTGLALIVLVLLLARLVIENKKLKDDNSLFI